MSYRLGKGVSFGLVVLVSLSAAGCSEVPGMGPTGAAIMDAASQPSPQFALIEISDPVLAAMARWRSPSFFGRFGDYRRPGAQTIGVGDSVQVTIWEAAAGGLFSSPVVTPDSTGSRSAVIPPQVVAADGSITVPYAGRIEVANRTPSEVEKVIVQRLQGKAIQPQALVTVTQNISNTVTVTGEVVHGARVPLSARGDRIMDAIAEAGGVNAPVRNSFIILDRGGRSVRVAMQKVVQDPHQNIYLHPRDVITVVNDPQTFTAVGATGRNSVVPFDAVGITLDQAIAQAGGLLDLQADPRSVFVLRYEPLRHVRDIPGVPPNLLRADYVPVAYHLDLRSPTSLFAAHLFPMRNKDILYVSDSPVSDLQKVLNIIGTLSTPTLNAAQVGYYAKQY